MRPATLLDTVERPPPRPELRPTEPTLLQPTLQDQCHCQGPSYDWVLNFYATRTPSPPERRLVLEEAERHGLGTRYNNDNYPHALSLTVGHDRCHVTEAEVTAALRLGMTLVEPRHAAHQVEYTRFPLPAKMGRFDRLYDGPALHLLHRMEHP